MLTVICRVVTYKVHGHHNNIQFALYPPGGSDFHAGGYQATFSSGETTTTVAIPITDNDVAELPETFNLSLTIPAAASSIGVRKGVADTATITIRDNDPAIVNFSSTQYTVNEGDGSVTVALTAIRVASFDYIVDVSTQDGTATGNSECCTVDCCKILITVHIVIVFNCVIIAFKCSSLEA